MPLNCKLTVIILKKSFILWKTWIETQLVTFEGPLIYVKLLFTSFLSQRETSLDIFCFLYSELFVWKLSFVSHPYVMSQSAMITRSNSFPTLKNWKVKARRTVTVDVIFLYSFQIQPHGCHQVQNGNTNLASQPARWIGPAALVTSF